MRDPQSRPRVQAQAQSQVQAPAQALYQAQAPTVSVQDVSAQQTVAPEVTAPEVTASGVAAPATPAPSRSAPARADAAPPGPDTSTAQAATGSSPGLGATPVPGPGLGATPVPGPSTISPAASTPNLAATADVDSAPPRHDMSTAPADTTSPGPNSLPDAPVTSAVSGLGVSPGITAGPALRMGRVPRLPAPRPVSDPEQERRTVHAALSVLTQDITDRAARADNPAAQAILEAQALIASDPLLAESCDEAIFAGLDAPHAVHTAFTAQADGLREAGGYLGERAADLEDLRDRAVAHLLNVSMPGIPDPGHPFILIADDLAPADTAALDPAKVLALVTVRGGPTSHTAILARGLALPAVVACPNALTITDGTLIHVDGTTGVVTVCITPEDVDAAHRAAARQQQPTASPTPAAPASASTSAGHSAPPFGHTADGHHVSLLLNIGSAADLPKTPDGQATTEGVGLLRTELLFLGRHDAPSKDEQRDAYASVLTAFPGRRVVLRTLDAGADKPLPFLSLGDEPNPALGIRGLRTARTRPDVLNTQLAAVAEAIESARNAPTAAATAPAAGAATPNASAPDAIAAADALSPQSSAPTPAVANVWVMAPMVSTPQEAADFAARVRAHGITTVGAMIEVPAAALRAECILDHVDFLSIGTNDLSQYTMAADRQCGALADLLDPWQPALLHLIAVCATAGKAANKPVGVCGEAASDPLLACVLTGMGISSLSMSPAAVPRVAAQLAALTLDQCTHAATLALAAADAVTARTAVTDYVAALATPAAAIRSSAALY